MKLRKFKFGIIFLLIAAILVPALSFAQEEDDEEDPEEYPCNPLVLGILSEMGMDDDCDYFSLFGVGPGQLKQAWRMLTMLEDHPDQETIEPAIQELLFYKLNGFGWGQVKHAIMYATEDVPYQTLLEDWRDGEDPLGWGQIKQAKALSELEDYDGTYEEYLEFLSDPEMGWGDLKQVLGYSGPPPWAKGGAKYDFDSEEDSESAAPENNGPPHGKAKGHSKNKDK